MYEKHGMIQRGVTISRNRPMDIPKPLEQLSEVELQRRAHISRVMTYTLQYLTQRFLDEGFEWLLPVVFSKSTDPLWPDPDASIEKRVEVEIYGNTVRATLSMIVHKMVACSLVHPKLFILSPNIRIERRERAQSGIHAYEFTQLDFEVRNATSRDIMRLVERTISELIWNIKRDMTEELTLLDRYRSLKVPETPFTVYDRKELEKTFGKSWEHKLLSSISEPVWIVNFPREFYDFEDFKNGFWDNYDLLLPNYGEVLSGGRREWSYEKIVRKMERDGVKKENYDVLLRLAKNGKIKPSAGAGIGIERLVSWIVGARHIGETQLFPKIPGTVYNL
ncbi:MAG: asparagine synthetase A [Candidatus Bathyarchaeia archaeon]